MNNQVKSLEMILGGNLEQSDSRVIPGICKRSDAEVFYFSVPEKVNHRKQFRNITNYTSPPFAQYGGASEGGCSIKLPDGVYFYALTYHGDLIGWKKDIEEGAKAYGSLLATIEEENFILNDGRVFNLSACQINFD